MYNVNYAITNCIQPRLYGIPLTSKIHRLNTKQCTLLTSVSTLGDTIRITTEPKQSASHNIITRLYSEDHYHKRNIIDISCKNFKHQNDIKGILTCIYRVSDTNIQHHNVILSSIKQDFTSISQTRLTLLFILIIKHSGKLHIMIFTESFCGNRSCRETKRRNKMLDVVTLSPSACSDSLTVNTASVLTKNMAHIQYQHSSWYKTCVLSFCNIIKL